MSESAPTEREVDQAVREIVEELAKSFRGDLYPETLSRSRAMLKLRSL